jgi:hypothetical protein
MTSRELSNHVVRRLVAAINDGDRRPRRGYGAAAPGARLPCRLPGRSRRALVHWLVVTLGATDAAASGILAGVRSPMNVAAAHRSTC